MAGTSSPCSPPAPSRPRASASARASRASSSAAPRPSPWRRPRWITSRGGRFILGLGSSHRVQVVGEHGLPYSRPIERLRETVDVVRTLLRDGVVSHRGELLQIERFDLWFRPLRPVVPVYLSGVFRPMLEVCGEIAEGAILTSSTLDWARSAAAHVAAGARRAGRDPGDIEMAALLGCAVGPVAEARQRLKPGVATYAGSLSAVQPAPRGERLRRGRLGHPRGLAARRPRPRGGPGARRARGRGRTGRVGRPVPRAHRPVPGRGRHACPSSPRASSPAAARQRSTRRFAPARRRREPSPGRQRMNDQFL